jgi:hypothetical protein
MTDHQPRATDDQPIDEVVAETVGGTDGRTTRREAVELELEDRGRSEEGAELEVDEVLPPDAPATGVLDEDRADPPEPSEPG